MTPDKLYLAGGASVALVVAGLLFAGAQHEIRYRLRQRRRGGYIGRGH